MRLRRRLLVLSAATAAALFLPWASGEEGFAQRAANPQLCAETGSGDAFVITLKDSTCSTAVTQVQPGTYDVVVHDYSTLHNFHLTGQGVDKSTTVAEQTTVTWTITFVSGSYHYQCDAHPTQMFGELAVQDASAVTMAGLRARSTRAGVLIRWRTGTEVDLLGFHVFRSRGQSWKRVSRSLIAANGSVSGASYRFVDKTAISGAGYRYRIRAMNRDGTTAWSGPVRAT